jgi:hypothetical protein
VQLSIESGNERIKQICNLLELDNDKIINWLRYKNLTKTPAELSPQQVDELVLWLISQWATQQGIIQLDIATKSYLKYVTPLINQECSELQAIKQWMLHVTTKTALQSI